MFFRTVDYVEGAVRIIDQTLLPSEEKYLDLRTVEDVAEAIRSLKVRGAPAIGITAAYGVLLSLESVLIRSDPDLPRYIFDREKGRTVSVSRSDDFDALRNELFGAIDLLAATRPTAMNLFYALGRMRSIVENAPDDIESLCDRIEKEAFLVFEEEIDRELMIGEYGSGIIEDGMRVLTHCNAGGLATAGFGTALGVIYSAVSSGKRIELYADETRPLFQGSRLSAWESMKKGIKTTILCDSAAASLIAAGKIDVVITGADRIAMNGDTANKIGTLPLAIICSNYGIPFYIAAPVSTFDPESESGEDIVIEYRDSEELTSYQGIRIAPEGVNVYNPAFDVTPASLITAIITEKGLIKSPFDINIGKMRLSE
ncbi:MAG: S-methyl-5-thioribose-1-phosphate isomerase [Candidatus Krumholzibacteriota bacterium]|nr:S-methyl-5-thioribose-1-phosphate isomerase [Candidatus Krumholzibacteriota bacterium]